MIPIFIASSDRFAECEWLAPFSIRENTESEVDIHIVRPQWFGMQEHGCTGFTNVRFAIPKIARSMGYDFAVYLDVDMLVLGDISELYDYRKPDSWVGLVDGSNEVSVIDTSLQFHPKETLHRYKKHQLSAHVVPDIPLSWNCEDKVVEGMNLLHFTALDYQPWFYDHPNKEAVALYESYRSRHRTITDA